MIATVQNVTLGISVDPNAAGHAKGPLALSLAEGEDSFWQTLLKGDDPVVTIPDTVFRTAEPDAANPYTAEHAAETQCYPAAEPPKVDIVALPPNALHFMLADLQFDTKTGADAKSAAISEMVAPAVALPKPSVTTLANGTRPDEPDAPAAQSNNLAIAEQMLPRDDLANAPHRSLFGAAAAQISGETNKEAPIVGDAATLANVQASQNMAVSHDAVLARSDKGKDTPSLAAENDEPPVAMQAPVTDARARQATAVIPQSGLANVSVPAVSFAAKPRIEPSTNAKATAPLAAGDASLPAATEADFAKTGLSNAENLWRTKWAGPDHLGQANSVEDIQSDLPPSGAAIPAQSVASHAADAQSLALQKAVPGVPELDSRQLSFAAPQPTASAPTSAAIAPSNPIFTDTALALSAPSEAGFTPVSVGITGTPSVAPAPAVSAPTPAIATNLTPVIVDMARNGSDGPIELALAPEELGRLTISLRQEGDFVRVSMVAERPETLDLLRRHAGDLLADLRQSGFSGASFSFGQSGEDPTPRFAQTALGAEQPASPPPIPVGVKHSPQSRASTGAGLDLRL